MSKIEFTQAEVDNYLKGKKDSLHCFYDRCLKNCEDMQVHADGLFPIRLLRERRPNEPKEVLEYREKIFIAKTKPTFNKVFSSFQKIRRSADWSIRFEDLDQWTLINEAENLEEYTMKQFPYFTSVTNWAFTLMLRKYLIDSNAVVFIYPQTLQVAENDFLKPFPVIFDSKNVLDYVDNDYCILNNPTGSTYYIRNIEYVGRSVWFVTTQRILRYDQIDNKMNFTLAFNYEHGLPILPAFKLKGILIDQVDNRFLYETKIAGMLPELDEAVREYSDLQAAKVLHIYPERWEYTNNECTICKGTGHRPNPHWEDGSQADPTIICSPCKGTGYIAAGPYSKMMLKPMSVLESAGGGNIPTPPAGFIQKDIEIVKVQEEGVRQHLYDALSAINFEFLAEVPLSQSGVAKSVDRDEANNTSHSVAEDVVSSMDTLIKIMAYYRYKDIYSFDEINKMLPIIPVPENYDILYTSTAEKELADAKTNKIAPTILNALEIDYASKRFNADPAVRDRLILILSLDPFPNIGQDEKMSMYSNSVITKASFIISANIQEFVQRAIDEDAKFSEKDLKEQKIVMLKFAEEQIAADSAASKVLPADLNGLPAPIQPIAPFNNVA